MQKLAYVLLCFLIICPKSFPQDSQPQDEPPDLLELRIIVVSSLDRAKSILARLDKGEDFAALAQSQSIDTTAASGGSLGSVALSSLRPELRDAVAGLRPGRISPIVQTPIGFAILKVEGEGSSANAANTKGANPALASTGSVKYTISLGGFNEAEVGLNNFIKPIGWDRDPRKICEMRRQSIAEVKDSLEGLFSSEGREVARRPNPGDLINAYYSFGEIYSYVGEMDKAVAQYENAYRLALEKDPPAEQPMNEAMGIAYLHKSEMENGVYRTPGDRCLLPMNRSNAYANKEDSRKAIDYFLKYLENKPDELEVRWLLNVAYMTIGGYPDQVPAKYRSPPRHSIRQRRRAIPGCRCRSWARFLFHRGRCDR